MKKNEVNKPDVTLIPKMNRMLMKLEYMGLEIENQRETTKQASRSLKALTRQVEIMSSTRSIKFTECPPYITGKNLVSTSGKKYSERKSFEHMLQVIDDKDPVNHDFLTNEMFNKNSTKKALKQRKRQFGFTHATVLTTDAFKLGKYTHPLKNKASLEALKKILYNNTFLHSPANQKLKLRKKIENGFLSPLPPQTSHFSSSPAIKAKSPIDSDLPLNVTKEYKEALKKSELEIGMTRVRLSRLLSLRGALRPRPEISH